MGGSCISRLRLRFRTFGTSFALCNGRLITTLRLGECYSPYVSWSPSCEPFFLSFFLSLYPPGSAGPGRSCRLQDCWAGGKFPTFFFSFAGALETPSAAQLKLQSGGGGGGRREWGAGMMPLWRSAWAALGPASACQLPCLHVHHGIGTVDSCCGGGNDRSGYIQISVHLDKMCVLELEAPTRSNGRPGVSCYARVSWHWRAAGYDGGGGIGIGWAEPPAGATTGNAAVAVAAAVGGIRMDDSAAS